jgi:ABC-type Mn2+/Zn2+ transport system permease subunit
MSTLADILGALSFGAPVLLTAGGVASASASVGVFVLLRRQTLAALALPQAVALGVAVGLRMGWPPLYPAVAAVALVIVLISSVRAAPDADPLLAAAFVGCLSLSMLVIASAAQHLSEIQNRYVGMDVAVSTEEALRVTPVLLLLGAAVLLLWRRWLLLAQLPAVAELNRVHPARWDLSFYALLACIVLIGTSSMGVVIVLAMLFLPAATVLPWCRRVPSTVVAAVLTALLFVCAGWFLSLEMEWPLSQSIGGVGFVVMLVSRLFAIAKGQ